MRDELNDLRQQEAALEEKMNSRVQQMNQLSKNLEMVMQEVTQVRRHLCLRLEGRGTSIFCSATMAISLRALVSFAYEHFQNVACRVSSSTV